MIVAQVELRQIRQLSGERIDVARQFVAHHINLCQSRILRHIGQQCGEVSLDTVIAQVQCFNTWKQEQRVRQRTLQSLTTKVNTGDIVAHGDHTLPFTHRAVVIGQIPRFLPVGTVQLIIDALQDGKIEIVQQLTIKITFDFLELLPDIGLFIKVHCVFRHFEHTLFTIVQISTITLWRRTSIDAKQL